MSGTLILCGTPIGNLSDMSDRLKEALGSADVVFAEDTRRSRHLLQAVGANPPMRSYFAGNEAARSEELGRLLASGQTVALVTDAGMPAVSDPGLTAVRVAVEVGAAVTVVPGPSAVTAAVAVSGLPSERFVFEGFLPRKGPSRRTRLRALGVEERTAVLFVSPNRLKSDLRDLADELGADRPLVVTRELTKLHEEVWRGTLGGGVEEWGRRDPRGEFTLVIGGAPTTTPTVDEGIAAARDLVDRGTSLAEAARQAATQTGVSRRAIYEALHSKPEEND